MFTYLHVLWNIGQGSRSKLAGTLSRISGALGNPGTHTRTLQYPHLSKLSARITVGQ